MQLKPLKKQYAEANLNAWEVAGEERDQMAIRIWHTQRAIGFYPTLESILKTLPLSS